MKILLISDHLMLTHIARSFTLFGLLLSQKVHIKIKFLESEEKNLPSPYSIQDLSRLSPPFCDRTV